MISVLSMVYVVPKSTRIHCGQGEAAQRVAVSPSTAWEASLPACWLENVTGLFKARLVPPVGGVGVGVGVDVRQIIGGGLPVGVFVAAERLSVNVLFVSVDSVTKPVE